MKRLVPAFIALLCPSIIAAQSTLNVTVINDANGNGIRDAGERVIPNVVISNQRDVVTTDVSGSAHIERGPTGIVFVSVPSGYRSVGKFWKAPGSSDSQLTFALQAAPAPRAFSFIHASDPHIQPSNVARTRRFTQLVDSIKPDFTIVTGDLVFDAMSQQEPRARSFFELFDAETRSIAKTMWTVPGNHDHFGIIPSRSHVPLTHPLYNRGMYHEYRGPDYYSFTYGGVHFIALNTLMTDDSAYYGRVDSVQLAWLKRDLATIPAAMPVVTFNHIPMVSAWEMLAGFADLAMVSSLKTVNGVTTDRHTVANVLEVMKTMQGHQWVLALGGHMHAAEKQLFVLDGVSTRFEQTAAIVGQNQPDGVVAPSGITFYTVRDGVIDAGRFVRMDPPSQTAGH